MTDHCMILQSVAELSHFFLPGLWCPDFLKKHDAALAVSGRLFP